MIRELLEKTEVLDTRIAVLLEEGKKEEAEKLLKEKKDLLSTAEKPEPGDRVFLARHPRRPHMEDFVSHLFSDFFEQKGDHLYDEDHSIYGGIARFHGKPVTLIGHRKGRNMEENLFCNFGMPCPEGYRKAMRIMAQAEKFHRPIITFIDTPGAYPGLEAEEHGQGEAIAKNLAFMSSLHVPVIAVVTGEGSSGGALSVMKSFRRRRAARRKIRRRSIGVWMPHWKKHYSFILRCRERRFEKTAWRSIEVFRGSVWKGGR